MFTTHQPFLNSSLSKYSIDSTLKSINKLTEKKEVKYATPSNSAFNFLGFFVFLSISVMGFQFYKRLK